ncbi:MAG: PIN domain-containing protein [Sulfurimicrobium sp.]|nr:PIN domain-containing protein [Sulfurimicrobium sp.]
MKTNYVLIDYENVHVRSLTLLKGEHFRVRVFLGPKNSKLPVELVLAMQEFGDYAEYVVLETPGSNALDFHIAYYLGVFATEDPAGFFHIISKDTGYDTLIRHLKTRNILSARSASIEEMPCFNETTADTTNSNTPTKKCKSKPFVRSVSVDDLIKIAVDDLIKRKASKPRTSKTLRNTIHAKCGKELPATDINAIYETLVKRGYVKVNGAKVTYALPAAAPESGVVP